MKTTPAPTERITPRGEKLYQLIASAGRPISRDELAAMENRESLNRNDLRQLIRLEAAGRIVVTQVIVGIRPASRYSVPGANSNE